MRPAPILSEAESEPLRVVRLELAPLSLQARLRAVLSVQ
jgi:hypothetical protein